MKTRLLRNENKITLCVNKFILCVFGYYPVYNFIFFLMKIRMQTQRKLIAHARKTGGISIENKLIISPDPVPDIKKKEV